MHRSPCNEWCIRSECRIQSSGFDELIQRLVQHIPGRRIVRSRWHAISDSERDGEQPWLLERELHIRPAGRVESAKCSHSGIARTAGGFAGILHASGQFFTSELGHVCSQMIDILEVSVDRRRSNADFAGDLPRNNRIHAVGARKAESRFQDGGPQVPMVIAGSFHNAMLTVITFECNYVNNVYIVAGDGSEQCSE